MGGVIPTPVTDLCAGAVHRSGNVELSLLNSRPKHNKMGSHQTHRKPHFVDSIIYTQQLTKKTESTLRNSRAVLQCPEETPSNLQTTSGHCSTARDRSCIIHV